jgi:hypothetical protein
MYYDENDKNQPHHLSNGIHGCEAWQLMIRSTTIDDEINDQPQAQKVRGFQAGHIDERNQPRVPSRISLKIIE